MSHRENGIVIGTVLDLDDPEKLGRVKVRLPQYNNEPTHWARLVSPMAGKERGVFFCPEVDDEVLVGFENGDPRRAYVFGSLWNKVDAPPQRDGDEPKNNWRFVVSRSGHVLKFDDTAGAERIELVAKEGKQKIVIDFAASKIQIECSSGDVEVSAPSGAFKVSANTVDIQATGQMTLAAKGKTTVQGATVEIN